MTPQSDAELAADRAEDAAADAKADAADDAADAKAAKLLTPAELAVLGQPVPAAAEPAPGDTGLPDKLKVDGAITPGTTTDGGAHLPQANTDPLPAKIGVLIDGAIEKGGDAALEEARARATPREFKEPGSTSIAHDEPLDESFRKVAERDSAAANAKAKATLAIEDGAVPLFTQDEDHVGLYSANANELVVSVASVPITIYPRCVTIVSKKVADKIIGDGTLAKLGVRRLLGFDNEVEKVAVKADVPVETFVRDHNAQIVASAQASIVAN